MTVSDDAMILSSRKDSILGRKAVSHEEGLQEQGEDDTKGSAGRTLAPAQVARVNLSAGAVT